MKSNYQQLVGTLGISVTSLICFLSLVPLKVIAQEPSPSPFEIEATDKIAFIGFCGGGFNVCLMNTDGSDQTALTDVKPGPAGHPSWLPDGQRIVFSADSEIFTIDVDGTNMTRLTHNTTDDRSPVWSPRGDKIAFVSNRSGNWDIYIMDMDGSNQVNLTDHEASDGFGGLAWSPDGTKIAFVSNRDDSILNTQVNILEVDQIYVITDVYETLRDSSNMNLVNLTEEVNVCDVGEYYLNPSWSPDGTQVAVALGCGDGIYNIYLLNICAPLQELTLCDYNNLTQSSTRNGALGLSWSPDGYYVVFVASCDTTDRYTGIFILDIQETLKYDSPHLTRLTDINRPEADNYYSDPAWWSPNS